MSAAAVERGVADLGERYGLDPGQRATLLTLIARLADDPRAPTSVREPLDIVSNHIADALSGLDVDAVRHASRAADIGAGAGFPGIALAVALPSAQVNLIESQSRKCVFMRDLLDEAEIGNAVVVCTRAEEWRDGLEAHDVVVARALAAQPVVLEYAAPLLARGGTLVDWRGSRDRGDEEAGLRAGSQLGLDLREVRRVTPFEGAENRHLHVFEKVEPTPARFPRRAGMASKRPLGRERQ